MIRAGGGGGLGVSQIPQAPARALATVYQNQTGRPIYVCIVAASVGANASASLFVDAVNPPVFNASLTTFAALGVSQPVSYIVPPNFYYMVTGVNVVISLWTELRS